MGAMLSCRNKRTNLYEFSHGDSRKRQRTSSSFYEDNPRLIPSLPDEISIQILARLPRIYYFRAKSVSRKWKSAILSPELYKVRKELGTTEEWLYVLTREKEEKLMWHALDPVSNKWQKLPLMPSIEEEEPKWALSGLRAWNFMGLRNWLSKKNILASMPFCGCALGSLDGSIYVIGGFCKSSAVNSIFRYDPIFNNWEELSPMSIGRAYSKTGILNKKIYVVGGVTKIRGGLTPLQSGEVFDPRTGLWSEIPDMPFEKAQFLPTAFLADLLKPIATGMTSYRGKLFVPQSLYCWPFFVDVGGEVYNPELNNWTEMPRGMGEGWPAKQAGTKLSIVLDGNLYAIDPSSSMDNAKIKIYDNENDVWKVVNGDVPIRDFSDSESPYLLAGFLNKLHVVTKDASRNIVVMQAERESGSDMNIWKIIATRSAGSEELVNCQILEI